MLDRTEAYIGAIILFSGARIKFSLCAAVMAALIGFRLDSTSSRQRGPAGLITRSLVGAGIARRRTCSHQRTLPAISSPAFWQGGYLLMEYYAPGVLTDPIPASSSSAV